MVVRGFWRHASSGQIWAVDVEDHAPLRCAGPLSPRDLDHRLLQFLALSTHGLYLLQADWSSYLPHEM
jgi:hypothetical protein